MRGVVNGGISHRQLATERLREHLANIDWSTLTPNRQRILDAFLTLATSNGVANVTMRMLAREINVKPPTLYGHFPDGRDEVIAECLRWNYYRFGVAVLESVEQPSNAEDFLQRVIRVHVTRQVTMPACDLWDIVMATDHNNHLLPDEVRADVGEWLTRYRGVLEGVALDMGYRSPECVVRVLVTILDGANNWVEWRGDDRNLEVAVQQAVSTAGSLLNTVSEETVVVRHQGSAEEVRVQ